MTNKPPLPADDPRQRDELDAFLDDLTHRNQASPPALDPTLAATVRHIHDLASEQIAADTRRAGKAHRWEDLMHTNAVRSTLTPFPTTATLPRSSAPPPIPLRPAMPTSRLRRLGGQSLGLVATVTLVLLVAASSLALYLSAPPSRDNPTMLPAAYAATPETDDALLAEHPDLTVPYLTTCTVQPRSIAYLSLVLDAPLQPNHQGTPELIVDSNDPHPVAPTPHLVRPEPDGGYSTPIVTGVPDGERNAATQTWALYRSCELSHELRRAAVYMSDSALLRLVYRDRVDLYAVAALAAEPRSSDRLAIFDQPADEVLADFGIVGTDRITATIFIERNYQDGTPRLELHGYVAFVRQNGIWLVDELVVFQG